MENEPENKSKVLLLLFIIAVFIVGALLYLYNPDPIEYTKNDTDTTKSPWVHLSPFPVAEEGAK